MLTDLRAVLFDLDGTLLDSFEFIYGAFEHAFALHGIESFDRTQIAGYMGGPLEQVYAEMAPGCDAVALTEAHRTFQSENIRLVTLFPHTIEVLEELKKRNMKIAAITTRSLRTSVKSLEAVGIEHYFDLILSAEDVTRHKPHPEPILKALEFLQVKPEEAIMVGDTTADIMAGKNAGIKTVAALYGFGGEGLLSLDPDYSIRELKELLGLTH
jgi:pyrophosphatase PpaX